MKDKKKIIIVAIIILIIGLIIYLISKKNSVTFKLVGEDTMIVEYGGIFVDPGYIAHDGFGNSISDKVVVTNTVDTLNPGNYKVIYKLNNQTLERTIIVQNITVSDLEIRLVGESDVYILKDTPYLEEGANVYNKNDDIIFNNEYLSVESDIDISKPGNYVVNYVLNYKNQSISVTRNVIVFDINYEITPNTVTDGKVKIELDLTNVYNFSNVKLPDNSIVNNKFVDYEVDTNGEYEFTITLVNNKSFVKVITVDNIIGSYVCYGEITTIGTKLTVSPTSDVRQFKWMLKNETFNGTNTYFKNILIDSAKVKLTFYNNKEYEVDCKITDKLVYHFKYDENNTKPEMRCNTYTSSDKIILESKLKQVVNEAGYGSRAGVVAAARFLVGGLDYKVHYQGPKTENSAIGRYQKIGLNIGQSGAWGCNVSGYTQGMDCTNFVSWAFYQNGIKDHPYNTNFKKVRDVINAVRVGDLLYTPCTRGADCKNAMRIDHVGIIIGIDSRYIYVAESTSSDGDAIIVTKWEKYNMPSSGKFSVVHFFKYASDGNVTDMWM